MNEVDRAKTQEIIRKLRIVMSGLDIDDLIDSNEKDKYACLVKFYQEFLTIQEVPEENIDRLKPKIQAFLHLDSSKKIFRGLGLRFSNIAILNFYKDKRVIPNIDYPFRGVRVPWIPESGTCNFVEFLKDMKTYFTKVEDDTSPLAAIKDFKLPSKTLRETVNKYAKKTDRDEIYKQIAGLINGTKVDLTKFMLSKAVCRSVCGNDPDKGCECNNKVCYHLAEDILYDCWEGCLIELGKEQEGGSIRKDEIYKIFKESLFKNKIEEEQRIIFIANKEMEDTLNRQDNTSRFSLGINGFIRLHGSDKHIDKNLNMLVIQLNPEDYYSFAVIYTKWEYKDLENNTEEKTDFEEKLDKLQQIYFLISSFNIEVEVKEDLRKQSEERGVARSTAGYMHDVKNQLQNLKGCLANSLRVLSKFTATTANEVEKEIKAAFDISYRLYRFSQKAYIASLDPREEGSYRKILGTYSERSPSQMYFFDVDKFLTKPDDDYLQDVFNFEAGGFPLLEFLKKILSQENQARSSSKLIKLEVDEASTNVSLQIFPLYGLWGGFAEIFRNGLTKGATSFKAKITKEEITINQYRQYRSCVERYFFSKTKNSTSERINICIENDCADNSENPKNKNNMKDGGTAINKYFFNFIGIGQDNYDSKPKEKGQWETTVRLWPDFWKFLAKASKEYHDTNHWPWVDPIEARRRLLQRTGTDNKAINLDI